MCTTARFQSSSATGSRSSLLLASLVVAGCAKLLGFEQPEPTGSAGSDGAVTGGMSPSSAGGSASGTDAGASAGGAPAGGSAVSGAGGDSAGAAGASAGAPATAPELGGDCSEGEDYACSANDPGIALECRELTWHLRASCRNDERCLPELGECRAVNQACRASLRSACTTDGALVDCDADIFEPPMHFCPFGCSDGRCLSGSGDQLIVHTEDLGRVDVTFWPRPAPVCFRQRAENAELASVIQDEVERSWGRLLNVDFAGWEECEDPAPGPRIEISFLDDCELRLASAMPLGFSGGEETTPFGICRTYRDASGAPQRMTEHEGVLRYVARHQFGHALGSEDDRYNDGGPMRPGLRASDAERMVLTEYDLHRYVFGYGHKPARTLASSHGACVTSGDGALGLVACGSTSAGKFVPMDGAVLSYHPDPETCLTLSGGPGSLVGRGDCWGSDVAALQLKRTRWSTPEYCVAPSSSASGSALVTAPCLPVGDPSQAWWFEIVDATTQKLSARLRFAQSGDCLAVTEEPPSLGDIPVLESCEASNVLPRHVFSLWINGQISVGPGTPWGGGPLCLVWDTPMSTLYFGSCNFDSYWLSGALETPDGLALGLVPGDNGVELRATSLGQGLPADHQIFDYAF